MAFTFCGPAFQQVHLASGLVTLLTRSYNPPVQALRFGLFRFRSPLLSESQLIYFPPGTEMVHFPGLTRTDLCIQSAVTWFYQDRFPDSEIHGSKPTCGSPWLIAACHVLRRLLAPRHPPYALSSLTIKLTQHIAFAANWMITHAVTRHGPCSKFAFPHCATLEQKICGLSHQFEETHSKSVRMPASISCQRAAISANNYRLKCLPVKGSATLVWSHVACNKKPGVKRRAYPSLLQAS